MNWDSIATLFSAKTNLFWAALVSAVVSAAVSYFFRKREVRHRLQIEYEYEQRKKLRNLIGRYHDRLLNASNSLSFRFWNLYSNHEKNWLRVAGAYGPQQYYFHSFAHRFLTVGTLIRQFEREAVFVDARIAEKKDFLFLRYLAALQWCVTDVALFAELPYDSFDETDHFFSDSFRNYCDICVGNESEVIGFDAYVQFVQGNRSLDSVLRFFDYLSPTEERYRWDRLVSVHLLLVTFINSFGYREQHTSKEKVKRIAENIRNREVLSNLVAWLPRHGLGEDRESKTLIRTCERIANAA